MQCKAHKVFQNGLKNRLMGSKNKKRADEQVHEELKGLNLQINAFGEIQSSLEIERINQFLDKHLGDKKKPDQGSFALYLEEE